MSRRSKAEAPAQLAVVRRQLSDLRADPDNVRRHGPENIAAIKASLARFGQQKPIVVKADGTVVAGNGTIAAAHELGWTAIDCVVTHLEGSESTAFAIADNRTSELADWDDAQLSRVLAELGAEDPDLLAATGFDTAAVVAALEQPDHKEVDAEPKVDQAGELAKHWKTALGQVWLLGDHRIACGDCTDAAVVAALLRGDKPGLMVTDPPYGVQYDAAWRHDVGRNNSKQTGKVHNDDRASWSGAWRHFPGSVAYVWHAAWFASVVERSLAVVGFEIRSQIIWVKRRFAISRSHYHWRHEPCWYVVRKGEGPAWVGGRKKSTVWADVVDAGPQQDLFAAKVDDETVLAFPGSATTVWEVGNDKAAGGGHSTQKPVACMSRPILNHGAPGDLVYEPFSGSGTTIIACEQTGRRCRAIELSPGYVAVALQRWQDATGQSPRLLT